MEKQSEEAEKTKRRNEKGESEPTPRRSLFSSNLLGNGNRRGKSRYVIVHERLGLLIKFIEEAMTTPPLPSSHGMGVIETLPHKPPFNVLEAESRTSTIEITSMDTPMRPNVASPLQDSLLVAQEQGRHE